MISLWSFVGCAEHTADKAAESKHEGENATENVAIDFAILEEDLKNKGYNIFRYKEGDTTYLMQQYYIVFLKTGPKRDQDSTLTAVLQEKHLMHLDRLYKEGYTSLTGPMGEDGEIRGIIVFNTPTQKMADSLAKLDPMVKAGRLVVESKPWWVAKGSSLK